MEIDIRPRHSGKTLSLIQQSVALNIPIVCANNTEVNRLIDTAKNLGYDAMPCPIPATSADKLLGRSDRCLVDNADWILEYFLKAHIVRATFTEEPPKKISAKFGMEQNGQ